MARRAYFAFHYQDVSDFPANVVRNHWMTKPHRGAAGFFDASLWENAKRRGDIAIKRLVNSGIEGTSTTCVLIGSQTFNPRWVSYETMRSFKRGTSMLAVHITSIAGTDGTTKSLGPNPLGYLGVTFSDSGLTATLHDKIEDKWIEYTDIDGSSSYRTDGFAQKYCGKGSNLGRLLPTYDWVADDGYRHFADWVA